MGWIRYGDVEKKPKIYPYGRDNWIAHWNVDNYYFPNSHSFILPASLPRAKHMYR